MSNASPLKLVRSFNLIEYPHELSATIKYNPKVSKADALFQHDPDHYTEFKLQVVPADKMRELKHGLSLLKIEDYFIFQNGSTISMHFKDMYDHLMALAMAVPEGNYRLALIPSKSDTPEEKLHSIAEKARQDFRETADGNISFIVDSNRRSVWASAQNGWDYIKFLQEHRKLKYQPA